MTECYVFSIKFEHKEQVKEILVLSSITDVKEICDIVVNFNVMKYNSIAERKEITNVNRIAYNKCYCNFDLTQKKVRLVNDLDDYIVINTGVYNNTVLHKLNCYHVEISEKPFHINIFDYATWLALEKVKLISENSFVKSINIVDLQKDNQKIGWNL